MNILLNQIISVTEARNRFNRLIENLSKDGLYILTKGGKPIAVLLDVNSYEKLKGVKKRPDKKPLLQPQNGQPLDDKNQQENILVQGQTITLTDPRQTI